MLSRELPRAAMMAHRRRAEGGIQKTTFAVRAIAREFECDQRGFLTGFALILSAVPELRT